MRQRAAASLLYQSKYAEAAFRNLLKLIFLKIVGRILAFYTPKWKDCILVDGDCGVGRLQGNNPFAEDCKCNRYYPVEKGW